MANAKQCDIDVGRLRRCYEDMARALSPRRGSRGRVIGLLAASTHRSESTVRGWIYGDYGTDVETVHAIEGFFGLRRGELLVRGDYQENEGEEEMREIPDYERDAARELYFELNDMVEGLYYCDPELLLRFDRLTTVQGFRYLGTTPYPFDYRESLLLKIRNAGFDLPRHTRDAIAALVTEAFGEDCGEGGLLYLRSEDYAAYLKSNDLEDGEDERELYSVIYLRRLRERLDAIFSDYMSE